MPRKAAGNFSLNAFVKDMIERNGIATVRNIEQIMKRLDKLENRIASIKKMPAKSTAVKSQGGSRATITGSVLEVIKTSRKGVDLETVQVKTGFDKVKIRNAFFILGKAGKIQRKSRGVYEVVKERPAKSAEPRVQKQKQARKKSKPVSKRMKKSARTGNSTSPVADVSKTINSK